MVDQEFLISKWKEGKDAWNTWIEEKKTNGIVVNIDFSNIDFSEHCRDDIVISFEGFNFGDGKVTFNWSRFPYRTISFYGAHFGGPKTSFEFCFFRDGHVIFDSAIFGDGEISFQNAKFDDSDIFFQDTKFGNGKISFNNVKFGNGKVIFRSSTFGNGSILFNNTSLENGHFDFSPREIWKENISFVNFKMKEGSFIISAAGRKEVSWDFSDSFFGGPFQFRWGDKSKIQEKEAIEFPPISAISFKKCTFLSSLSLDGTFDCIPDFRLCKLSHHLDFSTISTQLRRDLATSNNTYQFLRAINTEDHARLRRLKELAEGAKDHALALEFSADENRAGRWVHFGVAKSTLDMLFSATSNYGQSIFRPLFYLAAVLCTVIFIIWCLAPVRENNPLLNSALLSAAHTVPFLPPTKGIIEASTEALFGKHPPPWVSFLTLVESLLSFIFLFLIGLGLRNRFRL